MFEKASLDDLPQFKFSHAHNHETGTGCTVVIAPEGAVCGVDVRGGGPATRETDLLRPENMVEAVHAIVLAGGSAFGLEASCGVMEELSRREIGFPLEGAFVPLVCSACLFDLGVGSHDHPDKAMGAQAARTAFSDGELAEGNVGAGTGCSAGKLLGGSRATKTGFAFAVIRVGDLVVGALAAVNALGNVRNPEGGWLAGARDENERFIDPDTLIASACENTAKETGCTGSSDAGSTPAGAPSMNTTLGIVVTNAALTKAQATKVSSLVHDAYAHAIHPVHTSLDGDTVFTFASGDEAASTDLVGAFACRAMEEAIYRCVLKAESSYGLPSSAQVCEGREQDA